jgi:hypothetical protein
VKSMAELVVGADTLNRVLSPLLACTSNGLPTLKIGIGSGVIKMERRKNNQMDE